jgi:hypothetical protein
VYANNGDGTFPSEIYYGNKPGTNSVTAVDMDIDGDLDMVTTNHNTDEVSVVYNLNGGSVGSCCDIRGDADHSGQLDALDVTYFVNWMWKSGPDMSCPEEGDVNGDGRIDALDITFLVDYLWKSGPPPVGC